MFIYNNLVVFLFLRYELKSISLVLWTSASYITYKSLLNYVNPEDRRDKLLVSSWEWVAQVRDGYFLTTTMFPYDHSQK